MPPEEPRSQTALFVGLTIVLVVVLGTLLFLFAQSLGDDGDEAPAETTAPVSVELPDVVGLDVAEARAELEALDLQVEVDEVDDDAPEGEVLAMFPRAGTTLESGDLVTLRVSRGVAVEEVPSLVDLDEDDATSLLRELGFVPSVTREFSEDVDEGIVLRQRPAAGTELEQGETVDLVVSSGAELFELPDLTGRTERDAELELARLGLEIGRVREFSSQVDEDLVIRTEPSAGTQLARGDTVTLVVSDGPEGFELPDYSGRDAIAVQNELEAEGIGVSFNQVEVEFGSPQAGTVLGTNPPAGITVFPGQSVTLNVAVEGAPPTTAPPTTAPPTTAPPTTAAPTTAPPTTAAPADGG